MRMLQPARQEALSSDPAKNLFPAVVAAAAATAEPVAGHGMIYVTARGCHSTRSLEYWGRCPWHTAGIALRQ